MTNRPITPHFLSSPHDLPAYQKPAVLLSAGGSTLFFDEPFESRLQNGTGKGNN